MILYQAIAALTYKDFLYFTDATNEVMQILLGHFVALHVVAGPLIMRKEFRSKQLLSAQKIRDWFDSIVTNVRPSQQKFLECPMAMVKVIPISASVEDI